MVYHQSIAWAVNHDLPALVDALVLRRMWDAHTPEVRAKEAPQWMREAVTLNPYALVLMEGLIKDAADARTLIEVGACAVAGSAAAVCVNGP